MTDLIRPHTASQGTQSKSDNKNDKRLHFADIRQIQHALKINSTEERQCQNAITEKVEG
jgi:hypothetical protein